MRRRVGRTNFGCLFSVLLAVTAVYFAVNVGEPYVRYYRFLDGSGYSPICEVWTDSLGLPEAAGRIRVRRASNRISLSTSYYERVEMPLIVRDILFSPQAEWTY